jgi:hypothetical protein
MLRPRQQFLGIGAEVGCRSARCSMAGPAISSAWLSVGCHQADKAARSERLRRLNDWSDHRYRVFALRAFRQCRSMLMFSPSRKPATSSPWMKAASDPGIGALPRTPMTRRGSCASCGHPDTAPPRNVTKRRLIPDRLVGHVFRAALWRCQDDGTPDSMQQFRGNLSKTIKFGNVHVRPTDRRLLVFWDCHY